jgi:hypothetical protein
MDKERNVLRVLRCMFLLYKSVGCAIRRESAYSRRTRLLRKPKGPTAAPLETPSRGLSPLDPKESALSGGYRLIPRYGPCSVVCMRFLLADTQVSLAHNVLMLFRKLLRCRIALSEALQCALR